METEPESPVREALRLAWPATLSLLLNAAYRVNDQWWIQDLGPDAQAALGVTTFYLILNFGLFSLLTAGTLARVARHTGARDRAGVRRVWRSTLTLAVIWLGTLAVLGSTLSDRLVVLSGAHGEVRALASGYLRTIYLVVPLIAWKPVVDAVFIGLGNTFVPMLLSGLAVGLNFVLNPILIFGWFGLPALGVEGAALATGLSRGIAGLAGTVMLARWFRLPPRLGVPADRREVLTLLRIGAPVSLSTSAYALVFLTVLKTSVEPLGRDVQAGLGVAFNGLESLSYCGMMGPAIAASSLVGRRLGAGDPIGARRGFAACMTASCGFAALTMLAFLVVPRGLAGLFTDDPRVLEQAALYLGVVAWSQVATAADGVLQQSLAGAGRTLAMSSLNLGGYVLRIPLARFLSATLGWGAAGVWWALNLSNYLKLVAMILLFRRLRLFAAPPQRAPA